MGYKTYTTEAIVCGSRDRDTSDRSYLLFTREAGMLYATARSVREERSKQRAALQDFSSIRVSLIKGKSGWRIGSVEAIDNTFLSADNRQARTAISSSIQLLRRFLHGEEPQEFIFRDTISLLGHLVSIQQDHVKWVEYFNLRLLAMLGYIAPHSTYDSLINNENWLQDDFVLPPAAKVAISRGLDSSHL